MRWRRATAFARKPYGAYLIFYAVRSDQVVIERILNSALDYEPLLFSESDDGV